MERLKVNPRLRLAVGTGFLGSFTTYSAFALESVFLFRGGMTGLFLLYVIATPAGCIIMALAGNRMSKMFRGPTVDSGESAG